MIYDNPHYKKVKGSFILVICCSFCKTEVAMYQKVGKGGLLRMHIDRIVKSSVDLSKLPAALFCPNCKQQLAARVMLKRKKKMAYRMIRNTYNVIKK